MGMDEYSKRLDELVKQLNSAHLAALKDLSKLYGTCRSLLDRISIELVTCRRIHKETTELQKLVTELDKQIELLEQNITFALIAF